MLPVEAAAALEDREGIVDLTVALLRILRDHRNEYDEARQLASSEERAQLARFRQQLVLRLRDVPSHEALSLSGSGLVQLAEAAGPPTGLPLLTQRAVAEALDDAFGPEFHDAVSSWYWPRRKGKSRRFDGHWALVAPGDPIPLSAERRDRVRGARRSGRGMTDAEQAPDRLAHIKLAPEHPYESEIWIDFRIGSEVAQPEVLAVAVGSPTRIRDFPRPSQATFPYGPSDPEAAAASLSDLVATAGRRGVQLALFPELVLRPEARSEILRAWLALPPEARPRMVLPGSEHSEETGVPTNSASLYCVADGADEIDRLPPFAHHKFKPLVRRSSDTGEVWPIEPLASRPDSIRLHVSHGLTVAVLICRDFLGAHIDSLVADLEPDLLLVPSMTPETDEMSARAQALAAGPALVEVYLANAWPRASAPPFFAHPHEVDPLQPLPVRSPGVGVITLREGLEVEWIEPAS